MKRSIQIVLALTGIVSTSNSQQRVDPADLRPEGLPSSTQTAAAGMKGDRSSSNSDTLAGSSTVSSDYRLGPGDLLTVSEVNLEDTATFTDKTFRVDNSGDVTFPLAGRIHAAGLTTVAVEAAMNERLGRVMKDPQAVVGVAEFHSQPVSVLGAVGNPGMIQTNGIRNLFEVLSLAGGLRTDAGNSILITRSIKSGPIPLPDAKTDPTGQYSIASVRVKSVMSATDPSQNIAVMPDDVITVPKGEVVYVVGAVTKPGGFLLGESGTLSTLQVVSLAEGLLKTSSPARAEILRVVPGAPGRTQIGVNVKLLLAGKSPDVPLRPDDILFIPESTAKLAGAKALGAIITLTTGMAIYGKY